LGSAPEALLFWEEGENKLSENKRYRKGGGNVKRAWKGRKSSSRRKKKSPPKKRKRRALLEEVKDDRLARMENNTTCGYDS